MNLFKIDNFNTTRHDWGVADDFFVYPVGGSSEKEDFKIRLVRLDIREEGQAFEKFPGMKSFLVPIDKNLPINYKGSKMLIKAKTTFRFMADEDIVAMDAGRVFSMLASEDFQAKMEVLKFFDKLIVEDDFVGNKILFVYSLADDLQLKCQGKEVGLKKDDLLIMIPDGKYDFEISPRLASASDDDDEDETRPESAIIFGKVVL